LEGHFYDSLICNIVLAGCGLIITHLFREVITRQAWLDLPPSVLLIRVALAIPLLALIYLGCVYLTAPLDAYLLHRTGPVDSVKQHFTFWFFDFADGLFSFGSWASIYLAFHFLKERRRAKEEGQRLAVALSQARLDALRAQLNPHFFANVFEGLGAKGPPEDAVTHLASLLRYSLATDANATVSFETELNAVSDYLELELLRFDDRLRIQKQIQPEALSRPIPPMLLQTLVENAVIYGASLNPGISELSISAAIDPVDSRLCIRVRYTGHLGLNESRFVGTGLGKARERLQRLFGSDAELKIAEDPPGQVTAAVSVPNRQPTIALPGS
jgi:LytS/YehU family sensor histidine kinase